MICRRYLHLLPFKRIDPWSKLFFAAVAPREPEFISHARSESLCVEDLKIVSAQPAHSYRPVDEPGDLCSCRRAAVRIEHAVHAEVAIVLPLAVVAAVGIASVLMKNSVVYHLPDAASDETVVVVDLFPVVLHAARANAHGMRVFAEEIRPVTELLYLVFLLAYLMHAL